ncbi:YoaK family protein [Levilactobacillus angrenensis]|uniref:YoaK family protein n=1 Tax=Levilactobacillus angrenensis TaxID=2486020 RepID=A0ABW1U815_9LACO|nr:YoaK family protein [Levilactobacillus angrenensis]
MGPTVSRQFRPVTETILTLGATLVMGMVDADTFLNHGAVFVSAQTGNLVVFVVKLVEHGWRAAWVNVPVWIGYFLGCFLAQGLSEHLGQGNKRRQMRWLMLLDVVAYTVLASLQTAIPTLWLIFCLGIVAGYELTVFRQVGGIGINNGIMTGNTKNLATATYRAWFDGDRAARDKQRRIAIVLVTFILGCAIGARLAVLTALGVLWIATALKLILLAWLFVPAAMENPDR